MHNENTSLISHYLGLRSIDLVKIYRGLWCFLKSLTAFSPTTFGCGALLRFGVMEPVCAKTQGMRRESSTHRHVSMSNRSLSDTKRSRFAISPKNLALGPLVIKTWVQSSFYTTYEYEPQAAAEVLTKVQCLFLLRKHYK